MQHNERDVSSTRVVRTRRGAGAREREAGSGVRAATGEGSGLRTADGESRARHEMPIHATTQPRQPLSERERRCLRADRRRVRAIRSARPSPLARARTLRQHTSPVRRASISAETGHIGDAHGVWSPTLRSTARRLPPRPQTRTAHELALSMGLPLTLPRKIVSHF